MGDPLQLIAGRVPPSARRGARRVLRTARITKPQVSVVVLLTGSESAARAALDAVREQGEAGLEIVAVVMDERLRPLADAATRGDWRVRQVGVPRDEASEARRAGGAAARAPWVLFIAPRQLLLPGAVADLMGAREAGCAVVLGGLEGSSGPWSRTPLLGRLLIARERWASTRDDGEPDGQTAALSLLAAGFTEAPGPTLRDASTTRAPLFERTDDPTPELPARIEADRSMLAALADEGARTERAAGSLTRDLPRFLLGVELCDDAAWGLLHSHCADLVDAAGEAGIASVPVEDRVAAWLAAQGRREALVAFVAARRFAGGSFPTSVEDGAVAAVFEGAPEDLPPSLVRLSEDESGARVQLRRMRLQAEEVLVEMLVGLRKVNQDQEVPEAAVRLLGGAEPVQLPVDVTADSAVTRWMGEPHQNHDHGVLSVRFPLHALSPGSWSLEVELSYEGVRRRAQVTELDGHGSAARALAAGGRWLQWASTPDGVRLLVTDEQSERRPGAVVRRFRTGPRRLVLEIDAPEGASAALVAPGHRVSGTREGDQWVFDLVTDPWQLGANPAPMGLYRLVLAAPGGAQLSVSLGDDVADGLPFVDVDELHRKAVWRQSSGGLALRLDPPLDDQEAGAWAQRRLQQRYLAVTEPLDPQLVYFQSFLGQSPTDHPAAIQNELHRVLEEGGRRGARMLWGVLDSSMRAPAGAEPVLLRSTAWYDALARAGYVVSNIELEPWFSRREGQEVLETYHGYPSKAMGLAQWRARGLTPTHLEQMLRRTSGSWNNLLTPIPEMDPYYRENYAFDGRIISQGYPRQDALVGPGHEDRRATTRKRLGIAPHQRAVLYAPTWRDDLATNFRNAEALLHLSVDQAARALGPDYVVLLRGHRFHSLSGHGAEVLDVTAYPEVDDLILASDAAVLDYSSLRFDFALTGRPMVFLVPDLRHYTAEARGFLYDFAGSAPGPLVDTTMQVVEALADLPSLEKEWAPRIADFNARFNRLADGRAAERVVAEFFGPLLSAERRVATG